MSAISFFLGWTVIFLILYAMTKSKVGKKLLYYILWLLLVLVLVTHSNEITTLINSTGITSGVALPPTNTTPIQNGQGQ
jgi:hypothetical protein